jgi:hypothetical protein
MLRRCGFAVLVVSFVIAARPMAAAENALDAISSDAGVVVRLKNPQATIEKVADLVNEIVPGVGEQVRAQADGIGLAISNPTLAGVDKQSDWWVAVYPRGGEQEPQLVFVIPASDLKGMKAGLGESFKFVEHGKFGVYTEDSDAADKTAALLKGNGKSIAPLIDKDSLVVFDKGDISVFIHVKRLATVYKDRLTETRERITQALENAPAELPGTPGLNPKAIADVLGQLLTVLMQGLDDTQSCTIAAMISKEGLAFEDLVRVASNSTTDKLLQKSPPNALGTLASLPAGGLGYFGLHGDLTELAQWGMKMSAAFLGDNEQSAKELQGVLADLQKLKYGVIASSFGLGAVDEGALRTATITEVSEPSKLRDLSQKLFKAMGTIQSGAMKQTYAIKPDAEKSGQNSVDVLTVTMELGDAAGPEAAMMERFLKTLYGPEGAVTRMTYLKDRAVQANGGGKMALEKVLAALEKKTDTIGSAAPYEEARKRLSDKSNLLVLFDLPGFLSKAIELVVDSGALPIPINVEGVRSLDIKPSFLGFSLATEPEGLRVKTSIPVEQAQGVAKIVMTVMAQLNGGQ